MLFRDQLKRAVSLTEEDFVQLGIPVQRSPQGKMGMGGTRSLDRLNAEEP